MGFFSSGLFEGNLFEEIHLVALMYHVKSKHFPRVKNKDMALESILWYEATFDFP
jgi:hypothetical protein